jgi:iron-regulated transporter 1
MSGDDEEKIELDETFDVEQEKITENKSAPSTKVYNKASSIRISVSHFLTKWGDQMFDFVVPLVMIYIYPDNLQPPAIYALVNQFVCVVFGQSLGNWIDMTPRLKVIRVGIFVQNGAVLVTSVLIYLLVLLRDGIATNGILDTWSSASVFAAILLTSSVGSLGSMTMNIAVERDWVPVITPVQGGHLTQLNAWMKRIDLSCEVVAPVVVGFLIKWTGVVLSFVVVAVWNVLSYFPEYFLLTAVYRSHPELASEERAVKAKEEFGGNPITNIVKGWSLFLKQTVALVVVATTFLWLTVLSPHDPIMAAFLKASDVQEEYIGAFRGAGALFGVLATFLFPVLMRRIGLLSACRVFIVWEGVMLIVAMAMFYLNNFVGRILFMTFIILSRVGLYGYDMGEVQIMQTGVPEDIRGTINSIESSFTKLAAMFVFLAAIIASEPQQFVYLMYASAACINIGSILFLIWSCKPSAKRLQEQNESFDRITLSDLNGEDIIDDVTTDELKE